MKLLKCYFAVLSFEWKKKNITNTNALANIKVTASAYYQIFIQILKFKCLLWFKYLLYQWCYNTHTHFHISKLSMFLVLTAQELSIKWLQCSNHRHVKWKLARIWNSQSHHLTAWIRLRFRFMCILFCNYSLIIVENHPWIIDISRYHLSTLNYSFHIFLWFKFNRWLDRLDFVLLTWRKKSV